MRYLCFVKPCCGEVRSEKCHKSVGDNDHLTHLREYLECLMRKGSLGFTNLSCKSIREATHQIHAKHKSSCQGLLHS